MPSKYVIKEYVSQGIYHVYNRGVEKRKIFLDDGDYKYFLWLIKEFLKPRSSSTGLGPAQGPTLGREKPNFSEEIEILAYCLMPNHFHLLIRQKEVDSMSRFMKSLGTNYSMRFNRKYERVGSLFQGNYKAILVEGDGYLLHLTRYIHLNPVRSKAVDATTGLDPAQGPTLKKKLLDQFSSYGDYLGQRDTKWVNTQPVLEYFSEGGELLESGNVSSYAEFVESFAEDSEEYLGRYAID